MDWHKFLNRNSGFLYSGILTRKIDLRLFFNYFIREKRPQINFSHQNENKENSYYNNTKCKLRTKIIS